MNIGSSNTLSPALASILSQLSGPTTGTSNSPPSFSTGGSATSAGGAGNAVTGTGKAQISDAILDMFTKLHQASGSHAHGAGAISQAATTTASTASTMIDPLQQLMAAIGIDEDTEMGTSNDPNAAFQSYLLSQDPSQAG